MCPGNKGVEMPTPAHTTQSQLKHFALLNFMLTSLSRAAAEGSSKPFVSLHFLVSRMSFHPVWQDVEGNFSQHGLLGSTAGNKQVRSIHILKRSAGTCHIWKGLLRDGKTRRTTVMLTPASNLCTVVLSLGYTLKPPGSWQIQCPDASCRNIYWIRLRCHPRQLEFF